MTEKNIKSRIVHKHDTAAHWSLAENFIPKQGEIIVYDRDDNYTYERFKIGDGITNVNALPFASKNEITKADLSTDLQEIIDRASEAPRVVSRSISLPAANWTGNASPYSQVVSIAEATETSRIDLYPTLDQVISLSANGIALTMVNDNAIVTAYALNGKPTVDYDIQIVILDAVNITNAEGVSF